MNYTSLIFNVGPDILRQYQIERRHIRIHQPLCLVGQEQPTLITSGSLVCNLTRWMVPFEVQLHQITHLTCNVCPSDGPCCQKRQLP